MQLPYFFLWAKYFVNSRNNRELLDLFLYYKLYLDCRHVKKGTICKFEIFYKGERRHENYKGQGLQGYEL